MEFMFLEWMGVGEESAGCPPCLKLILDWGP